ncbi:MAG: sulfotransferase [Pseudomonadales bacterium]
MADSLTSTLRLAHEALLRKDLEQMHRLCLQVLNQDPNAHRALFLLAHIPAAHGNPDKALELARRALRTSGPEAQYLAFAGQQHLALNQQSAAREAAGAALEAGPEDAHTFDTIGVIFSRTGAHERALPCFEHAVAMVSDRADYQYNLASSSQFLGHFEVAREAYQRAIALRPGHFRAHSALSQLETQTPENNHIERLEKIMTAAKGSVDATLHLGHALAKEYEDLGDYAASLAWLERAKAGKRAQFKQSAQQDQTLFAAARRLLQQCAAQVAPAPVTTGSPIFVVGMPRTGTTLVDRILSSHSDVTAVGELTQFALLTKRAVATRSNLVLDAPTLIAAAGKSLDSVAEDYVSYVGDLAGEEQRPLDKMPLNFFYIPLILKTIPDARIIVLRRNPMDTCLSNYRQLFATSFSYYRYAYDLEQTAAYYSGFAQLMDDCCTLLPSESLLEVHYEDLVADLEPQVQQLLEFCDLDWQPECLAFHDNEAPVATASSVQVRTPLYQRASGRWRRYGDALAPLAQALEQQGIAIE